MLWFLLCSTLYLASALDTPVETKLDDLANSEHQDLPGSDIYFENNNEAIGHRNILGFSMLYDKKCKSSIGDTQKFKNKIAQVKGLYGQCKAKVSEQVKKYKKCDTDFEAAENKEKELRGTLKTCNADMAALKKQLATVKAEVAACESSQDQLNMQLADLREANGLITADNRVLVRDLEECDENEEHCSENLEECDFRCPSGGKK